VATDLVDVDHVGMRDLRERLALADQPRRGELVAEQLDRDAASERRIPTEIHDPHPTAADHALDVIAADPGAFPIVAKTAHARVFGRLGDRAFGYSAQRTTGGAPVSEASSPSIPNDSARGDAHV
jgi:hypothetical protein